VKWTGTDVENPVFTGVTVCSTAAGNVTSTDNNVQFKGTYNNQQFTVENKSILFVGTDNSLYWPTDGASIGAQRAYFQLTDGTNARNIVLNFDGDEATGISLTPAPSPTGEGRSAAWYDLQGRKLSGKPSVKGMYVHDGKKVVIK
jgi:hypothetical protein